MYTRMVITGWSIGQSNAARSPHWLLAASARCGVVVGRKVRQDCYCIAWTLKKKSIRILSRAAVYSVVVARGLTSGRTHFISLLGFFINLLLMQVWLLNAITCKFEQLLSSPVVNLYSLAKRSTQSYHSHGEGLQRSTTRHLEVNGMNALRHHNACDCWYGQVRRVPHLTRVSDTSDTGKYPGNWQQQQAVPC